VGKLLKGASVQAWLARRHTAASKIQSFVRMRWLVELMNKMRQSAKIIQRFWRQYFYRKEAERKTLQEFYSPYLYRL
jgi:hypothetical protein